MAWRANDRPFVISTIELTGRSAATQAVQERSGAHLNVQSQRRPGYNLYRQKRLVGGHMEDSPPAPHSVPLPGKAGSQPAWYNKFCQAEIAKLNGPSPELPM